MPSAAPFILAQVFPDAPELWPVVVIAGVGVTLGVFYLYPSQLRDVGWPWRGLLPGLRLFALLALIASILKPIAMRLASAEERGSVVVLVDTSRSMSIVDNSRTPAQWVALADALGKLPAGVRSDAGSSLSAGLERLRTAAVDVRGAQEDLDYARVSGRDIQYRQKRLDDMANRYTRTVTELSASAANLAEATDLLRQLGQLSHPPNLAAHEAWRTEIPSEIDAAAAAVVQFQNISDSQLYESNAQVRSACDSVATLSRFSLVEEALLRPGGLVAEARKEAAVTGYAVSGDITPLTLTGAKLDAIPDGQETDLTGCIARAVAAKPVRAVVLFSDGRQVGGDPVSEAGMTPNHVPVFTVNAAAAEPPHDVSFASVSAASSVFAGQSITVKASLRHAGFNGDTIDLHCRIGDEPEQVHKVILHAGKPAGASFTERLRKPGVQRLRLWFPPIHGEASVDNNQAERLVKVVPDRLKVLMIAGSPTWDFQYVRNALSRYPEVQVKDFVLDSANPHPPLTTGEILQQDVILLFDVPVSAFDEKHWDAVERVAHTMGGSVILVAGPSHLPAEYYRFVPTATLLPFRAPFKPAWNVWPGEEPTFRFDPTSDGDALEFLKLPRESESADTAEPAPRRWEQLPGFFHFLQLPEINDDKWKPPARALLVEEESRLPVLTEMRLGAGRTFFIGLDETWRWRLKVGERDQDHFWWQLIQYASEDPYFVHDGPLALDTDRVSAEPGETIHVRARTTEELTDPQPPYVLDVLRAGKVISTQPLSPSSQAGGRFTTSLSLPAGEYEIRWTVKGVARKEHSVSMPLHVAATSEAELADLSGDPKMLRQLAEGSGGEFLTLEAVNRLPERLAAAGDAQARYAPFRLWDSPYLFALVVGCLGTEWALRKRLGLA